MVADFILIPDEFEADLIAALCLAALNYADPSRLVTMLYCVNPAAAGSLEGSLKDREVAAMRER